MKRIQTDFINNLGIGAFAFLSILELCGLIEYVTRNLFIVNKTDAKLILWLPEIISLIVFIILIFWIINKYSKLTEINTRKALIQVIGIFFGIVLLQFLFTYFGSSYLIDKYPTEFDLYIEGRKGNYILQSYIAYIPILKYLIFGTALLIKKQLPTPHIIQRSNG